MVRHRIPAHLVPLTVLVFASHSLTLYSQEAKSPAVPLLRQPADDDAEPLKPKRPATDDDRKRAEALAWYMTGKLRQQSGTADGKQEAYEAYKKAVEIDPGAVEVLRELIPLAFSLNRQDEGVEFAQKAVAKDPNDYEVLRQLGLYHIQQRRIPDAVDYFERALASERLNRKSPLFVFLNRDLALLYSAMQRVDKSADAYEVVFDALLNPDRYDLGFQARRALAADETTAFERMGKAFADAKRYDLALQAYGELAAARDHRAGPHCCDVARIHLTRKDYSAAEAELEKYLDAQLQSRGREAYELLRQILEGADRSDELLGRLEELAAGDPRNATLQYFLADQLVLADQLERAEELYLKVLKGSGDAEGHLGLAGVYRKQRNADKLLNALIAGFKGGVSVERLTPVLEEITTDTELLTMLIDVGNSQMQEDIPQLELTGSYLLARLAAEAERDDDALRFYKYTLDGKPPQAIVGPIYREYGALLFKLERYEDASEMYDAASRDAQLREFRVEMLYRLSLARELNDETDKALAAILEARRMAPSVPFLHYQEGWVFYHSRQWDKAISIFEEVMKRYAGDTETVRRCQFSLSNIYVQQGDVHRGEEILEKVLEEDPDDPSVNNDLGYLYADQGKNLEKAEKMIRKAIEAEPENAAYLDSMGWVLFRLKRFDEAVEYLEKAVQQPSGGDATILEHLGDCYEQLKRTDEAQDVWKRALEKAAKDSRPDEELLERLRTKTSPDRPPSDSDN